MKKLLSFLVFCLIFFIANAQNQTIDNYLQKCYEEKQINGNVLVVQDGKKVYERSFGLADVNSKEALRADHRFNVGSIYKEFPAVAIMQLQEQGKLTLEDTLDAYITGYPSWSKKISIQNLLQYTSGLPRIPWGNYFRNNIPVTEQLILEHLKSIETLHFEPGSDYLYTNYSPVLLSLVVEKVSGLNFESYVEKYLFKPAKMDQAFFAKQTPYTNEHRIAKAFGNDLKLDRYAIQEPLFLMSFTAEDLYQWMLSLHSYQLISKESLQVLSETVGDQSPLGVVQWKEQTLVSHHHHGSSGNYEAVIRYFPKNQLYIVLQTNQKKGHVSEIATELQKLLTD